MLFVTTFYRKQKWWMDGTNRFLIKDKNGGKERCIWEWDLASLHKSMNNLFKSLSTFHFYFFFFSLINSLLSKFIYDFFIEVSLMRNRSEITIFNLQNLFSSLLLFLLFIILYQRLYSTYWFFWILRNYIIEKFKLCITKLFYFSHWIIESPFYYDFFI